MARIVLALLLLIAPSPLLAQVSAGTLLDLGIVKTAYADPRHVHVWLPSGYRADGPKYAVLYMHDGQNLYDKKTAGYGMEWQLEETLDELNKETQMRPSIIVGIWNTPIRLLDYLPAGACNGRPPSYRAKIKARYGGEPLADGFLKFIVREL